MFGLLYLLFVTAESQVDNSVPVQSAVISLIDDVDLTFGEAGVVKQVQCQTGEVVTAGQLLAVLDDTDAKLQVDRVTSELEMARLKAANDLSVQLARKSLEVATTEVERAVRANEKFADTVSASEIDRLRLRQEEARLQIEQAERDLEQHRLEVALKQVELEMAKRQIERRHLYAPNDGIVVRVDLQEGEWAQPGQTFCRIIRTDRVRAEGFVSTADGDIQNGQSVKVKLRNPATSEPVEFEGRVTFVDPEIDTITGQYRIWAEIPNQHGILRPGHHPVMSIIRGNATATTAEPTELK